MAGVTYACRCGAIMRRIPVAKGWLDMRCSRKGCGWKQGFKR